MEMTVYGYWRRLGVFRTLPLFFVSGAALEWFMINVRIGKETFCKYINFGTWVLLVCKLHDTQ